MNLEMVNGAISNMQVSSPLVKDDLECDGYGTCMLERLSSLRQHETLCDLTLVADNEHQKVHRVVMAACSDYFKCLLTIDMKEKSQKTISLKGVPAKGLAAVINFAYTGKLSCALDNIQDVLLASTHLQVTEAVELCSQYLINLTNTTNSVDMYNLGEQFNLPYLCEKSLTHILDNLNEVVSRGDYLRFSEKFLAKILEDNRLKFVSELALFQVALKWLNANLKDRLKYLYFLMCRIRFPLIPPQDLVEIVMNEPLMKNDPQCLELILEANKFHMLPSKQPYMQNLRTRVRSDSASIVVMDMDDECLRAYSVDSRCWNRLSSPPIEAFHAQLCTMRNYLFVCGGVEMSSMPRSSSSGKCVCYDPRFNSWMNLEPMQEARNRFILCSDGYSLYAIGGFCNGVYKSVVEKYSARTGLWTFKKSMMQALSCGAACVTNGTIFVTGGQNERGVSRSFCFYTIVSDTWTNGPPMFHGRMDHVMGAHGMKLYAIGGYDKNFIHAFDVNKTECFDLETNQWSILQEASPKFSGIYSCRVGALLYTVGGFSYDENKKKSEMWCYNMETGLWQLVGRLAAPAMGVACAVLYLPNQKPNVGADQHGHTYYTV